MRDQGFAGGGQQQDEFTRSARIIMPGETDTIATTRHATTSRNVAASISGFRRASWPSIQSIPALRRKSPPAITGNGSTTQATDKESLASNFTAFLQLLTTQLKNQNPLDPLDTNQFTQQLVQFAQVEQQLKSNDQLSTLGLASEVDPADPGPRLRRHHRRRRWNDRTAQGQGRALAVQRPEAVDRGDHDHQLDGSNGLFQYPHAAGRRPGLQLGRPRE